VVFRLGPCVITITLTLKLDAATGRSSRRPSAVPNAELPSACHHPSESNGLTAENGSSKGSVPCCGLLEAAAEVCMDPAGNAPTLTLWVWPRRGNDDEALLGCGTPAPAPAPTPAPTPAPATAPATASDPACSPAPAPAPGYMLFAAAAVCMLKAPVV
jgi:hypothetical protein